MKLLKQFLFMHRIHIYYFYRDLWSMDTLQHFNDGASMGHRYHTFKSPRPTNGPLFFDDHLQICHFHFSSIFDCFCHCFLLWCYCFDYRNATSKKAYQEISQIFKHVYQHQINIHHENIQKGRKRFWKRNWFQTRFTQHWTKGAGFRFRKWLETHHSMLEFDHLLLCQPTLHLCTRNHFHE